MDETPNSTFDLDLVAYSANYQGNALYARLLFIAKQFPTRSAEAYDLLSSALKRGCNSVLYCQHFSNRPDFDRAWVDETERKNHLRLERLEADFTTAKASMVKESIRTAYSALGRHHSEVGNLQEALRAFTRSRDYTSMPRHTEEMLVSVCTLAMDLQRPHLLGNYLINMNITSSSTGTSSSTSSKSVEDSSPVARDKLRALSALLSLSQGDFANAARRFASVESPLVGSGNSFGSVLSGEDIALGAVLCGVAALGRAELQTLLLESPHCKAVLDLVPALRDLLTHFLAGRYKEVKAALGLQLAGGEAGGEVSTRLELDIHLQPHATKLLDIIQDKLLLQYFRPYNAIRMSRAVDDLYPTAGSVEERIAQQEALEGHVWKLIEGGKLEARIDAGGCCGGKQERQRQKQLQEEKEKEMELDEVGTGGSSSGSDDTVWSSTLRRVQRDERAVALQTVWEVAQSSAAKTRHSLLRLSLMKHSFGITRGGGGGHLPQHHLGGGDEFDGGVRMMEMEM